MFESFSHLLDLAPLIAQINVIPPEISDIPERYKNISISNPDTMLRYYFWIVGIVVTVLAGAISYLFKLNHESTKARFIEITKAHELRVTDLKTRVEALKGVVKDEQAEKSRHKDDFLSTIREVKNDFLAELRTRDEKEEITLQKITLSNAEQAKQFIAALKEANTNFLQKLENRDKENTQFREKIIEISTKTNVSLDALSTKIKG